MPLLLSTPASIGELFLTADGESDGAVCFVEWRSRGEERNKRREAETSLSGVTAVTEFWQRRSIVLFIPWAPSVLVALLEEAFADGGIQKLTVQHPQDEDEREIDVEYLRVYWGTDSQWEAGDPVEGLYIELANHGASAA